MAGWGDGAWNSMTWGGLLSSYIKIIRIKASAYLKMFIKPKQGS